MLVVNERMMGKYVHKYMTCGDCGGTTQKGYVEILGFMGDTGYGSEGTKGKFPVHLHLGIYIQTPYSREMSVNPYWVLKAVQKKIRKCVY